ncbi:MAG TPA: pirin family protein [Chitinophagaceae bacterium]|nr:pirin family protein [Chitinophagaceae bacterium]
MKEAKQIEKIFHRPVSPGMVGDGFRVYNYFPSGYKLREKLSPFLMLDFNPAFDFGASSRPRGVDVHPHKGFETVTIAYKGSVEHYDSTGNSGIINPGDLQWMTAGAGILHKEFHEKEFSKKGGPFEMIQLWVNLPKKDKLTAPKYQALVGSEMNKVLLPGNSGIVNVIAGNFSDAKGSASTFTEINMFDISLNQNGEMTTGIPAAHNTAILVVEGDIEVNGQNAEMHDFFYLKTTEKLLPSITGLLQRI